MAGDQAQQCLPGIGAVSGRSEKAGSQELQEAEAQPLGEDQADEDLAPGRLLPLTGIVIFGGTCAGVELKTGGMVQKYDVAQWANAVVFVHLLALRTGQRHDQSPSTTEYLDALESSATLGYFFAACRLFA